MSNRFKLLYVYVGDVADADDFPILYVPPIIDDRDHWFSLRCVIPNRY